MWLFRLKTAFNNLKLRPVFALSVIVTLSVTMGILLSMVNLNHVLLVKSLPYANQDRLYIADGQVFEHGEPKFTGVYAYPIMEALARDDSLPALAIANYSEEIITSVRSRPKLRATNVTPQYFSLLSTEFAVGRGLSQDHGLDSSIPVAVISYDTWQNLYDGRNDILQQSLVIRDISFQIIGVTSADFIEPEIFQTGLKTSVWLPWTFNSWDKDARTDWTAFSDQMKVLVRLNEGMTIQEGERTLTAPLETSFETATMGSSHLNTPSFGVHLVNLKEFLIADGKASALLFLLGGFALALIAVVNVSNLLLSRAAEQQRTLAIQATVGASRAEIFKQVFAENVLLAASSIFISLLIAGGGTWVIKSVARDMLPRVSELALTFGTVSIAIVLVIVVSLLFTWVVGRSINYEHLIEQLKSSGKGSGLQISRAVREVLLISQIALAAALLVTVSSIMQASFQNIAIKPGFEVDGRVYVNLNIGSQQFSREERIRYIDRIIEELEALPQINNVSNSLFVPMMSGRWRASLKLDLAGSQTLAPNSNLIDHKYIPMMGMRLIAGENFSEQDVNFSNDKVIINSTLAEKIAPDGRAVGKKVFMSKGSEDNIVYDVIGVVEDIQLPSEGRTQRVYRTRFTNFRFIIEETPGQQVNKQSVLDVITSINSHFSLYNYERVEEAYTRLIIKDIFILSVTITLSVLTLILAGLGIYGVLSYSIRLRRYELGVRMCIGASPGAITKMVLKDNAGVLATGIIGSLALVACTDLIATEFIDFLMPFTLSAGVWGFSVVLVTSLIAVWLSLVSIVTKWPVFVLRD